MCDVADHTDYSDGPPMRNGHGLTDGVSVREISTRQGAIYQDDWLGTGGVCRGEIAASQERYFHGAEVVRSSPIEKGPRRLRTGSGWLRTYPEGPDILMLTQWRQDCDLRILD